MKKNQSKKISIMMGILVAVVSFILLGAVSALIKNPFFIRMNPIHFYDYIFLILTALLFGIYIGLWHYTKKSSKCSYFATGGTFGGFLSFGCALCNKLLLLLLGVAGITAYFMPLQPIIGVLSILLLSYAVYKQIKILS